MTSGSYSVIPRVLHALTWAIRLCHPVAEAHALATHLRLVQSRQGSGADWQGWLKGEGCLEYLLLARDSLIVGFRRGRWV